MSFLFTHMMNDEKTIREFCDDLYDSIPNARIIQAIYAKKGWDVGYLKRLKLIHRRVVSGLPRHYYEEA